MKKTTRPIKQQRLCWGAAVSPEFRARVLGISPSLGCDPNHLMACMAAETNGRFKPDMRTDNGEVGLIRFDSRMAGMVGTSPAILTRMTAVQQLDFVERYLSRFLDKTSSLQGLAVAIGWPLGFLYSDETAIYEPGYGSRLYFEAMGLDTSKEITKKDLYNRVAAWLERGLLEENSCVL